LPVASELLKSQFDLDFDCHQRSVDGQKPVPIQHTEAIIGAFFECLAESN
jgi:hypothetical protein